MMITDSTSGLKKSILFAGVIILLAATMVLAFTTTNSKQDIRSHASNETDSIVDSDALMMAGESEVSALENDADLQTSAADDAADDSEMAELNAL